MYNLLKKRKGLNSSQIYLSISKADKKSKVSKKSKNAKMYTVTHVTTFYTISKFASTNL